MSDFTIIIQGPIHNHSIENIEYYQSVGPVIISCYETDNWQKIANNKKAQIILTSEAEIVGYNSHNIYRQCITTLKGLESTETKFAIKLRSDEKYGNLQPLIDKIQESPEKFITNNVFFKRRNEPLHPSDHVIIGKTDKLKIGFSLLKFILEQNSTKQYPHLSGHVIGVPWFTLMNESLIFGTWLLANHPHDLAHLEKPNDIYLFNLMQEFSDVVTVDEMGEFIWSLNTSKGRMFFNTSDQLYNCDLPSIKQITEV